MFSTVSLATVAGQALLLILAITATIVVATCLLRNSMKRHKPFQKTCKKLWVHTSHTSVGFSSTSFNSTEDGFDSCSSNIDERTQQRKNRETDCDVIFPHPTLLPNRKCGHDEKEMQQGSNTLLPTVEIEQQEDGEHFDDVIDKVHIENSEHQERNYGDTENQQNNTPEDLDSIEVIYVEVGSVSYKKVAKGFSSSAKENTEQQQVLQSYKPQEPQDLESIEEIYVNVASHTAEDSALTTDSESEHGEDVTIQPPQECAAVRPQGSEYDYIASSHHRIKKPKNFEDVEEIYDVVGNNVTTGKDSVPSSRIVEYPVSAPYEVAMSSNKTYVPSENVPDDDGTVTKTDKLRNDVEDSDLYDEIVNRSAARRGRRVKENIEQQQTSQSYKLQESKDLESIEEIYVNVASHAPEESALTTDSESEHGEDTIQPPQQCAAVRPQGREYDYIESSHHRIKKPKNFEDVEEIYDVVGNNVATRKDSGTSSSIEEYPVSAPYEVAMSSNKASEGVPGDDVTVMKTEKLRNDVEDTDIYDVIVSQSAARRGSGRRAKENTEQQQTSQSYKPEKPQDLESIEEIYVSVASHAREESAQTTDSESENGEDVILQFPQECAAVTPQGSEYDYIESSQRRIKKPKNIKDVEEMYDVVVNQLATRKNSETSSSIQPYSVPAPYEVAISSSKGYAASESVPVTKNEAYGASEGGKIKGHTYDTFK